MFFNCKICKKLGLAFQKEVEILLQTPFFLAQKYNITTGSGYNTVNKKVKKLSRLTDGRTVIALSLSSCAAKRGH